VRRLLGGALVLLVPACAAHNLHRVPLDLNAQLAPLIDEAWTQMEENAHEPLPVGGVPVAVHVEPVAIQWLPYDETVPPGGSTLDQAQLRQYIVDALRGNAPPAADPERSVRLELEADLHRPDALAIRVRCALLDARAPGTELAHGSSSCLLFERRYCHGCRDRWTGLGTELATAPGLEEAGSLDGGVFVFFPVCHDSGPGYTKH